MAAWRARRLSLSMSACAVMPLPACTIPAFDTGASSGPGSPPRTASQASRAAFPPVGA